MTLKQLFSLKSLLACAALASAGGAWAQDHGHLYISAYSTNAGAQLYFDNGDIFAATSTYVKTLNFQSSAASRYFGHYDGNITVTPRSFSTGHGADYGPFAAAPGSVIHFQITDVKGPAGGAFEFWETTGSAPAFSIPVGGGASNLVKVTLANGAPGDNPYGHIHGRRFTATSPGIYSVTFRAFDLSTNGPGGGAIHTPSDPLTIVFQAGFNIASVARTNNVATIKIGTALSHNFTVLGTTNILDTNAWTTVASTGRGDDHFRTVQDSAATNAMKMYRVVATPFVP
jgi:hypothetical protein